MDFAGVTAKQAYNWPGLIEAETPYCQQVKRNFDLICEE